MSWSLFKANILRKTNPVSNPSLNMITLFEKPRANNIRNFNNSSIQAGARKLEYNLSENSLS